MSAAQEVRQRLVQALEACLIGPYNLDDTESRETLGVPPSRWYMAGFLAPEGAAQEADADPAADEELGAGVDETEDESAGDEPEPKQRKRIPASIGLSVLLPPGGGKTDAIEARVRYADYVREPGSDSREGDSAEGARERSRYVWTRIPRTPSPIRVPLDPELLAAGVEVPDSDGVILIGQIGSADVKGLPKGTRALALFLVNRRQPSTVKGRADEAFLFQASLELHHDGGFVARADRRGEDSPEWDDKVADLNFRNHTEYAVGHGVAGEVPPGQDPVQVVRTTWVPVSEVRRVATHSEPGVAVGMEALAEIESASAAVAALAPLTEAYGGWIEEQAALDVGSREREETRDALLDRARSARKSIDAGIALLEEDPEVFEAFRLANLAMAMAARRRNPERYADGTVPEWRLFQLAFVLLNLVGVADGQSPERQRAELIFFPTGGGKTEAYLGVIAFALVLRRLRGRGRPDGGYGVAVLLRYTLRLLTLDQLGRAATLICALESLRADDPSRLGDVRFSVGLWVGQSATANTISEVSRKIDAYRDRGGPSPFPLTHCPWCNHELGPETLVKDDAKRPASVLVSCGNFRCDFATSRNPDGLPVLFVDEQVYRELPPFVVATVDKFAMLPWRGETGMLFGRVVARDGGKFYGPLDREPKSSEALPNGLRPPELIVQDELHLISGPLGTMVGLYETAIDMLCTFREGERTERPKIIAATATVRRAREQINTLFKRRDTRIFPPPGVDESETFFARVDRDSPGRLYAGVAAASTSLKQILIRTYEVLLLAAERCKSEFGPEAADPYMTLVGYFNSLRELGGMRRCVEDDIRTAGDKRAGKLPQGESQHRWLAKRNLGREPVELTSRETTAKITTARSRLADPHGDDGSVDVLLASNMISVGVDIDRLGLMVVAGQPKTTSEYIQASSRVGRDAKRPGLVVTCFNLNRPRDRSHYERFDASHQSFYRFVEAMSLTPFSGPALDRGLAGTLVAMTRLDTLELTPPDAAIEIEERRAVGERAVDRLRARAAACASENRGDELGDAVGKRGRGLLDAWQQLAVAVVEGAGTLAYSRYDKAKSNKHLLRPPIGETLDDDPGGDEGKFVAPTSMRDVEPSVHLWLKKRRLGTKADSAQPGAGKRRG